MRNDSAKPPATGLPGRPVTLIAYDGVSAFEFGVVCEIFGQDWSRELSVPWYDFSIYAASASVTFDVGFRIETPCDPGALRSATTVIVPPTDTPELVPDRILDELRSAHERGARIVSLCTGALILAAAGLLSGRRVTTHWADCDALVAEYPDVQVDPGVLYVDDGDILTSAGSAACIDLCVHVVRQDHGADIAARMARHLVTPPHRDGGQAQYIDAPWPAAGATAFADTLAWAQEHLDEPITVEDLAVRSSMSERSFARHFAAATGTTPYRWLLGQRVQLAQRLLESSNLSIDAIADKSGFSTAANLRKHFGRAVRASPHSYRQTFRSRATAPD